MRRFDLLLRATLALFHLRHAAHRRRVAAQRLLAKTSPWRFPLNLTCFTNGAKRRAASELMVVAAVLLEAIDLLRPPPIALKKTWDCVEGVNAVRVG